MGRLASRPKIATTVRPQPTPMAQDTSIPTPQPTEATPESIAQQRVEHILRRSRSRLGTVLSSFRGVLTDKKSPQRKSLLGE